MDILIFLAILVLLIVVHEFGHFITAKRSGVRVDEFGIGFPPRALTLFKKGETVYTLNWLPFGGFVKIFGEDPTDPTLSGPDTKRSLAHQSRWIQALVLVAGVAFNVLLAWVFFFIAFMAGTPTALSEEEQVRGTITDRQLLIVNVVEGSPAAEVGLMTGDRILGVEVGNEEVSDLTPESITAFIGDHSTEVLALTYEREGETESVQLQAVEGLIEDSPERSAIGIGMGVIGTLKLPPHLALWEASKFTVNMLGAITVGIVSFLVSAFTLSADFSQVAGPVGIVGLVGDAASFGVVSLLMFSAFISLNLAVINLLPVPALDGGRLLFVAIEGITGMRIKPQIAQSLNTLGFVLLILLMVVVTYNDILRIIG